MDKKSVVIALVAYCAGELVTTVMTKYRLAKVDAYNIALFDKMKHHVQHLENQNRVLKMDAQAARNLATAVVNGADPQQACEQHDVDVMFLNLIQKEI